MPETDATSTDFASTSLARAAEVPVPQADALAGFRRVDPLVAPVLRGIFRLNIIDLRVRRKLGIPVF